jgi:hypothetical protein
MVNQVDVTEVMVVVVFAVFIVSGSGVLGSWGTSLLVRVTVRADHEAILRVVVKTIVTAFA